MAAREVIILMDIGEGRRRRIDVIFEWPKDLRDKVIEVIDRNSER